MTRRDGYVKAAKKLTVVEDPIGPGVYDDLPEDTYHADPALSKSGAQLLLPPSCPAKYLHNRQHPPAPKRQYDEGHVAHKLVLGRGANIRVLEYPDFRTAAAREERDEAHAAGEVPILAADYGRAVDMAAAVQNHEVAAALFTNGRAEVSAFWRDEETGVMRRGRFDWLRDPAPGKRLLIGDLKTARSAEPDAFGRAAADYGYDMQAANYQDAAVALGLGEDPRFLFVIVEKEPPHVVTVGELDDEALRIGRHRMRQALRIYADCLARDVWPGYTADVATISLPGYFTYKHQEALT